MKSKIFFSLLAITLVGIIVRIHAISPFKFYSDSYQNLLVAQNISKHHNVVGFLGKNGILYPPFFMWSRPGYPLLINSIDSVVHNKTRSATIASILAGIVAIPLAYFFIRTVFKSALTGTIGALLLSLSFNHVVWSGYIMTETTGILVIALLLWRLFLSLDKKTSLFNDFLIGALIGFSIFSRYEYIVLLLPLVFILVLKSKHPLNQIAALLSSFLFIVSLGMIQLFPLQSTFQTFFNQSQGFMMRGILLFFISLGLIIGLKILREEYRKKMYRYIFFFLVSIFYAICFLALLQILIPSFSFARFELTSLRNFIRDDFLIMIFALIGLFFFLKNKKFYDLGLFTILSIFSLAIIYNRINPLIERYWTHTIPFLLIPASYSFSSIFLWIQKSIKTKKMFNHALLLGVGLFILILYQLINSYSGIKNWNDASWSRMSYEEKAAQKIKDIITDKNAILIASLPEPYYYNTGISTQSVFEKPPFIIIDDSLDGKTVYVINDMGMRIAFPRFSQFLTIHAQRYKVSSFAIYESFHYQTKIEKETHPVTVYKLKLSELKKLIMLSTKSS